MSETTNTNGPVDSAAAPAGAVTSTAPGAEGGAPASAPDAGSQGAAPAAKPKRGESAAVRAAARAESKRAAASSAAGAPNSSTSATTAPGGTSESNPAGATPAAASDTGNGGTATAGAEGGTQSPTGSTVTAPDDWSEEGKAAFAGLPTDEARSAFLGMYKDMHRQFTSEMSTLAELRKGHEELHRTVEAHGIDAEEANRVLSMAAMFAKQPRDVLKQLAAQAGVEVFFERPLPPGEIPEFKTTAEMVEYVRQQTLDAVTKQREAAEQEAQKAAELERHKSEIRTQLAAAHEKFGDGFVQQRTAVMERMVQPISAEDAYSLITLPALRQQAEEGARAKQELAALRAKVEQDRMRATVPPTGAAGGVAPDLSRLSPAERAARRAEAKIAARANA